MGFERGKTTQKLEVIGELKSKKNTGTLITFLPDPTIFTITTEFKFERLAARACASSPSSIRASKSR